MNTIISIVCHTAILICAIAAVVVLDLHGDINGAGTGLIGAIAGVTGTSLFNQLSVNPSTPTRNGNRLTPPTLPAVPPTPPVA